jgi:hypothetical protein
VRTSKGGVILSFLISHFIATNYEAFFYDNVL